MRGGKERERKGEEGQEKKNQDCNEGQRENGEIPSRCMYVLFASVGHSGKGEEWVGSLKNWSKSLCSCLNIIN